MVEELSEEFRFPPFAANETPGRMNMQVKACRRGPLVQQERRVDESTPPDKGQQHALYHQNPFSRTSARASSMKASVVQSGLAATRSRTPKVADQRQCLTLE